MTSLPLALSFLLLLGSAPPSREEKLAAIATVVKTWRAHPKGSPAGEQLSVAVAVLVLEAAGAQDPLKPTPAERTRLAGVVSALKAAGADPAEAVDAMLKSVHAYACASKQTQAKLNLRSIFVAEKAYFAEHDRYEKDLEKTGFVPPEPRHYAFEVVSAEGEGFKARAVGLGEMAGDEWEIDHVTASPRLVKSVCPQ